MFSGKLCKNFKNDFFIEHLHSTAPGLSFVNLPWSYCLSEESCLLRIMLEAVVRRCFVKKVFLEISQNSQENTCARVSFFTKACNFIKKETLAQVFSREFYEISKSTFFYRTPPLAASVIRDLIELFLMR